MVNRESIQVSVSCRNLNLQGSIHVSRLGIGVSVVDLAKPKSFSMDTTLYNVLLHVHSAGRWVVLLLLLFAIINSLIAGNRPYIRTDNRLGLLLTISADLMLLIGIVLWYFGNMGYKMIEAAGGMSNAMKDPVTRFYAVEHLVGMLIAIILIHIGKAQGKKKISDKSKHRRTLIFYFLALLIILASIPWPFREIGAGRGWY
jgi:hypothetical protein